MKTLTAALSLAAVATGTAGAAIAYASTAPESAAPSVSAPAPTTEAAVATKPGTKVRVRFRKCRAGAHLEGGKCVRHVVRTVIEPAPVVTAVSAPPAASKQARTSREKDDDHPPKIRRSAVEHPENETDHEEAGEPEDSTDHDAEDAPESHS